MGVIVGYDDYQKTKYFSFLDGMRALSSMIVVSIHIRNPVGWLHGDRGVIAFFVISGYLITTLALREEQREGSLNLKAFYARRSFRIFPLYFLTVAIYAITVYVLRLQPERQDVFTEFVPYLLTYTQEFGKYIIAPAPPFAAAWSLGVEEKFYLVWPVLAFMLMRRPHHRIGLASAIIAVVIALRLDGPDVLSLSVIWHAHILIGCILAIALHQREVYERMLPVLAHGATLPLAVAATGGTLLLTFDQGSVGELTFGLAVLLLIAALIARRDTVVHRALSGPKIVLIGQLSYALYLFHQLTLNGLEKMVPESWGMSGSVLMLVLGIVLTLPACYVAHLVVEKPMIAVGRRMSKRIMTPAARV